MPPEVVSTKPRIDSRSGSSSAYNLLLKRVKETFLIGQQKIERAKIETYWQTGKLIHEHILHSKDRAEFGKQVIKKLARDLETGDDVLYRALKFHQRFPISATSRKLSWSHYVELSKIPDDETRRQLTERAAKSKWTAKQLAAKIQQEASPASHNGKHASPTVIEKLIPKLGTLYAYRLVAPESAHEKEDNARLWIDLGFKIRRRLPAAAKGFRAGQVVESVRTEDGDYTVRASKRTQAELFTYKVFIERVIDGDTFSVKIDFGFEIEQTHYLRLRGIDCPELKEADGKKAKAFVEKVILKAPFLLMTSSRSDRAGKGVVGTESDKYGRYVADLWIPKGENRKDWVFLNQVLLDEGFAVRYPD